MAALRRSIGLGQGIALYVGAILGPGLLALPAVAAETAGPASLVAWVALALLSLPMSLTFAALARAYPQAGGFAGYTEQAFGPLFGAITGWLFFLCIPSGCVIVALIAGQYGAAAFGLGVDAAYIIGGLLVLSAFAINLVGLKLSGRIQIFVTGGIVVLIILGIIGALPKVQSGAFEPFAPYGLVPIGLAAVQLFWAFAGWEAITPLAEEFHDPGRDMLRATLSSVFIVGITYTLLAVATIGTNSYGPALNGAAPLGAMAAATFGVGAQMAAGIIAVFVAFGALNAYIAGTSRLGYAMGRNNAFPRWFAALHPKWSSPHHALAFLCAGFLLWLMASRLLNLTVADLLPISTSSYIATYVLSMAAGVKLLTGWGRFAAITSLVACVVILLFVGAFFIWLGGVVVACLLFQITNKRKLAQATAE